MNGREGKPKAREGLLTTEHSKRGRRFLTVLDPETLRVTLLEPWEHELLLLCDGARSLETILELQALEEGAPELDLHDLLRCLKFFEKQSLVEVLGLRRSDAPPPGPRTLAQMQAAYAEWHKEPAKTGQRLSPTERTPPFPRSELRVAPGLSPTVALPEDEADGPRPRRPVAPGTTLVLAGSESALGPARGSAPPEAPSQEDPADEGGLLNLLEAVDDAVREADELDRREKLKTPAPREMTETIKVVEPFVVEGRPPAARELEQPPTNVSVALDARLETRGTPAASVKPLVRAEPEAVLMPTVVGAPPPVRAAAGVEEETVETVRLQSTAPNGGDAEAPNAEESKKPKGAVPSAQYEEGEDTALGGMLPIK